MLVGFTCHDLVHVRNLFTDHGLKVVIQSLEVLMLFLGSEVHVVDVRTRGVLIW